MGLECCAWCTQLAHIYNVIAVDTFLHCDSLFLLQCSSSDQVSRYEGVGSIVDVWILVVLLRDMLVSLGTWFILFESVQEILLDGQLLLSFK